MKLSTIVLLCTVVALAWAGQRDEANEEVEVEEKGAALAALQVAVSTGDLGLKIGQATQLVQTLDGAKQLKERTRSIELVIANGSKYPLRFSQEHFDSGTWFSQPDLQVLPGEVTIATVANRQGSWFTGVTGGMAWEIEGTGKYLILGFTNPFIGSFKTWIGVLNRSDAEYGYDHSENDSVKMYSQNGFALLAQLKSSEIADRRFVFGIKDEQEGNPRSC